MDREFTKGGIPKSGNEAVDHWVLKIEAVLFRFFENLENLPPSKEFPFISWTDEIWDDLAGRARDEINALLSKSPPRVRTGTRNRLESEIRKSLELSAEKRARSRSNDEIDRDQAIAERFLRKPD